MFLLFTLALFAAGAVNAQKASKLAAARTVQFLYQDNGGFTAYFNDGTYYIRAGEPTAAELTNGFRGKKAQGKYVAQKNGLKSNGYLAPFKMEDGTPDYQWLIINGKKVNP